MRVRYSAADQGGCGHYRLIYPAQVLAAAGHDVAPSTAQLPTDTDVVVIQRPLRRVYCEEVIPLLHRHGIAVVVELDDDFDRIDPQNAAWPSTHPRFSPDSNSVWLRKAARMADLVTVSTPALAERYGQPGRVAVLPNYIPEAFLTLTRSEAPDGVLRLGWTGTTLTHPGDLDVARAGIQQGLRGHPDWRFQAIGSRSTLHDLGVDGDVTPWVPDQTRYARAYARLDLAVVPLRLGAFNEAKSWLKGLEAAALRVPFIATPTGPYEDLHRLGAGVLATRPKDWTRHLRVLMTDSSAREDLTAAGWDTASRLTTEAHAWRWMEAWATARALYEKRSAAA